MKTNQNGTTTEQWFDHAGRFHRDGGPAETISGPSGVLLETYYRRGDVHRTDGPAVTMYSGRGTMIREEWHQNGKMHRFGAPARIEYRDNGDVRGASFRLDGTYYADELVPMLYVAGNYDDKRIQQEFACSPHLAPLADDGPDRLRAYLPAIGAGLRTVEGIRAYADGTPLEWIQSFEEGAR